MASKKVKIEYGLMIAPVGVIDSESSMTKKTFFEKMEVQYPSADGWVVTERSVVPAGQTFVVTYHLQKVNE
jgi:hypothetical protein